MPLPRPSVALLVGALAATGSAQPASPPRDLPEEARVLLRRDLQFGDSNIDALMRGQIIRKTLDAAHPDEVAAVGAIRIGVPRAFLIDRMRDIVTFKKSDYVLEIGTFGTPPRIEDLAQLSLPADDVDAFGRCRQGSCDVKLTGGMLERLQAEVDWSGPERHARASEVFKQLLVERVAAYGAEGAAALGVYVDKRDARAMEAELADLRDVSGYLAEYAPGLHRFFEEFPRHPLSGGESLLYWSKEVYGLKPVISVTHLAVLTRTIGTAPISVVASQGIYASHYFRGSLALTIAFEALDDGDPAVYFVYINRSRVDALGGAFSGLRRWMAGRRVRDGMDSTLPALKRRLEHDYATSQPTASPIAISPSSITSA